MKDDPQLELFPIVVSAHTQTETIEERFEVFHQQNPHIYRNLVSLARIMRRAGRTRISMKLLFERLRWEYQVRAESDDAYEINNDYTSRYSRLIMAQCPDLVGLFETRRLREPAHE